MRHCIDSGSVLCNTEEFDLDSFHDRYKLNGDLTIAESCDIINGIGIFDSFDNPE